MLDWHALDRRLISFRSALSESSGGNPDGTHRPIVYNEMDNLGEVTASDQYDGDTVAMSFNTTTGMWTQPSSIFASGAMRTPEP